MPSAHKLSHSEGPVLDSVSLLVFAVATGAFAGNLYLAQPLIELIGKDLDISASGLGLIVMLTQIGYALGMFFIGPLGDVFENRKLILMSGVSVVLGLLVISFSNSSWMFLGASLFVGITAVGTQIIIPLAANLASDEKRGAQIGMIMAGLLSGIMLARPASSFIASFWGWRSSFLMAAVLMSFIVLMLWFKTPRYKPVFNKKYSDVLASMIRLPIESAVLRRRAFYQAIMFCVFNMFWTSSSLVLTYNFGLDYKQITVFVLAGAGGALAAPIAGKLADRNLTRISTGVMLAILFLCMSGSVPLVGWKLVIPFGVLAIILDAATQANQVLGQSSVYAALPESRARANAFYMTSLFIGGAIGSLIAPICFAAGGWVLVSITACALLLTALACWATEFLPFSQPVSGETSK
jgi:predicted MFS family arabinose efflux permease